jgi:hypothetical protein
VSVKIGLRQHMLVDLEVPQTGAYMTISSLAKEKHNARSIYVLTPRSTQTRFKIGRSHEADLKVNDISVSRIHAVISYTEHGFTLEDNDSKFGTLVLLHGKQELSIGQQLSLQVNKAVLTFAIKSSRLLIPASSSSISPPTPPSDSSASSTSSTSPIPAPSFSQPRPSSS